MLNINKFKIAKDIIQQHRGYFFDKETMKFFRSRVLLPVFVGNKEVYFVTSEKIEPSPRTYTVRAYNPTTDSIRTVSVNRLTRHEAMTTARNLARIEIRSNHERDN
jgi:hypothetical protein